MQLQHQKEVINADRKIGSRILFRFIATVSAACFRLTNFIEFYIFEFNIHFLYSFLKMIVLILLVLPYDNGQKLDTQVEGNILKTNDFVHDKDFKVEE